MINPKPAWLLQTPTTLSAHGDMLVRWVNGRIADLKKQGDVSQSLDMPVKTYFALVTSKQLTPAEFFTQHQKEAQLLWSSFFSTLDDVKRIQYNAEFDALQQQSDASQDAPEQATESAAASQPAKTITLVEGSHLTEVGASVAAWALECDLSAIPDTMHRASVSDYRTNIHEEKLSPEYIFEAAPAMAERIREAYNLAHTSQPTQQETKPVTETKPTTKKTEAPRLAFGNATLTSEGKQLAEWLTRYIPDDHNGRSYFAFVTRMKMMQPGQFFAQNPAAGRSLWEVYQETAPETAVHEAQRHIAEAEKLLQDVPAGNSALAESKRQIRLLLESMQGYSERDV